VVVQNEQMTDQSVVSDQVRTSAVADLQRVARSRVRIGVAAWLVAVVAALVFRSLGGLLFAAWPAAIGTVFLLSAARGSAVRRTITSGPAVLVRYEGRQQQGYGSIFGLFRPEQQDGAPFAVLSISVPGSAPAGTGWLFDTRQTTSAALVSLDGTMLGVGKMVDDPRFLWSQR